MLKTKITNLPFTEDLKNILAFNNVATIDELLSITVQNWHNNFPGFTYHHQQEIITYLNQNMLMGFIKEV